jgi:hypothetical protein
MQGATQASTLLKFCVKEAAFKLEFARNRVFYNAMEMETFPSDKGFTVVFRKDRVVREIDVHTALVQTDQPYYLCWCFDPASQLTL